MLVKVLGAAAGGAFPQWNCACDQCQRLRSGTFAGQPRTQAQIAVSEDGVSWTLLNASPDLRFQIEATPQLWPAGNSLHSPIKSVVITAAEADTVAGLLSLREFQPLDIYATPSVLRILREDNSLFALLDRVPRQAVWKEIQPDTEFRCRPAPIPSVFLTRWLPWLRFAKSQIGTGRARSRARLGDRFAIGRKHGVSCPARRKLKNRMARLP